MLGPVDKRAEATGPLCVSPPPSECSSGFVCEGASVYLYACVCICSA